MDRRIQISCNKLIFAVVATSNPKTQLPPVINWLNERRAKVWPNYWF